MKLLSLTSLLWMAGTCLLGEEEATNSNDPAAKIDRILTQLEKRSDGLKDIRCNVVFVEEDRINLTKRTKHGGILFMITEPNPHFLIHFEKTVVDGVLGKREWYLFDGRWLHEAIERIAQVTKREIAPPGEKIDLFDLETAPFPLPFGQKKEKILKNFDVTLVPPGEHDPPHTDHLVCVPKPESRLRDKYDQLEFHVHQSLHLPIRVIVIKNDGLETIRADFPDLTEKSINAGVKKRDFARPAAWKKYQEVVEE